MRLTFILVLCPFLCLSCNSSGPTAECQEDRDCPSGEFCRKGECDHDCVRDDDCPDGYACTGRGKCEEGCRQSNNGVETCDGVDNDCDGETDEEFPELGQPCSNQGCEEGVWVCRADGSDTRCNGRFPSADDRLCDAFDEDCDGETDEDAVPRDCPLQLGVCAGAQQVCTTDPGWSECDYGPEYTQDLDDQCDRVDNDCDGETDEDGVVTLEPELGDQAGDGVDNNCNGLIDEAGGVMVPLTHYAGIWIDAYEASIYENPDCTGVRYGADVDDYPPEWPAEGAASVVLYACSLPGVIPSGYLSWQRAKRACESQGKRLCAIHEWGDGCTGGRTVLWPYGSSWRPGFCNDPWGGEGHVVETGSLDTCISSTGVADASGNLCEWLQETDPDRPGNAFCGGFHYYCEVFVYDTGIHTECNPDIDWHYGYIEGATDCCITDYDHHSFPVVPPQPTLGARCCYQAP